MTPSRGPRDRRAKGAGTRPGAGRRPAQPGRGARAAGGTRPGGQPTTGGSGSSGAGDSTGRTGRSAPLHVRRMITLVGLMVILIAVIAPVASGYLRQRASITAMQQQIKAEEREITALEAELERWEDPAYVEQQARQRLRFVKEGEVSFTVIDDTGNEYTEALPGIAPLSEDVVSTSPWYGQVWESIRIANEGLPEITE